MRCCWVFVIVFDFCYYFCTSLPFISRHMLCHATTWCDVCLFFSSHLQWMSSYDSIWIEHRKTQQKTMAMLRAWFLTPPQRKWNERERKVCEMRASHCFVWTWLIDWGRKEINTQNYTWNTFTISHSCGARCVCFCINNKLQYNGVKSQHTHTHSHAQIERVTTHLIGSEMQ